MGAGAAPSLQPLTLTTAADLVKVCGGANQTAVCQLTKQEIIAKYEIGSRVEARPGTLFPSLLASSCTQIVVNGFRFNFLHGLIRRRD